MLFSISFTALAAALSLTFENAAPASARRLTSRLTGPDSDIESSYIVKLKDGINITSHINSLPFSFSVEDESSPITDWWPEFFVGYSGIFVGAALDAVLASPDVQFVEKNGIVRCVALSLTSHIKSPAQIRGCVSDTNEPWNLQAISTQEPVGGNDVNAMTYTYSYNEPAGAGVDIYIVDSGVYIQHEEFEGRATFPWAAPGLTRVDGHGHGTHVAGVAAGKTYGIAKRANIIAVRVLNNNNRGTTLNFIRGINWVAANVRSTQRPSIASLAFSSDEPSESFDLAATLLVGDGVTAVTAAGNDGVDASNVSPARAAAVFVAGASDITNTIWPSSNFGRVVDVFAPGVAITSAGITAPDSTAVFTGTSQACAHVAGLAAYLRSTDATLTPGPMFNRILNLATHNAISGVPAGTTTDFVYNGGAQ
jgi:cerevisin